MLVLPLEGEPVLVVPALEAPRVPAAGDLFASCRGTTRGSASIWSPVGWPRSVPAGGQLRLAVSDRAWATTVLALQRRMPEAIWVEASTVTSPIRAVKDPSELEALRVAGAAADRVAAMLQAGTIPLIGRTEAQVSADLGALLIDEGHTRSTSPSWAAVPTRPVPITSRAPGSSARARPWSAISGGRTRPRRRRRLLLGHHPHRGHRCAHRRGRARATACSSGPAGGGGRGPLRRHRRARRPGGPGDHRGRRLRRPSSSTAPGTGSASRSTRTRTWWSGNQERLQPGHAFSVEPGIYLPGRFGMRLEDIVVIGERRARRSRSTRSDHGLVVVDA